MVTPGSKGDSVLRQRLGGLPATPEHVLLEPSQGIIVRITLEKVINKQSPKNRQCLVGQQEQNMDSSSIMNSHEW
jgi:hypothetical protein